ncbi:Hint domain-containing protein [Maritimibacter sp. DP1N21-5]|uniref:Hint domain-containing protein n=1 Tax=Maritimibacter sp. DP1N21-5 TaxID=2836867 RepID=UPI001C4386AE|nr:Hint domain-containing protein [Maritimibacter sp. DP1N21-5]MBV7409142.1 Hint domain-containing protein [Maritimibacter sp. DP1N21-5]
MGTPIAQTGSVTEDQGVAGGFLTASGDANYTLGINDTGQWTAGTQTGTYGTLTINSNGVWTYSASNDQPTIQALNSGQSLQEVFTITSQRGSTTVTITINGADEPPCFTRGTLIETPHGPRRVEDLRVGDEVLTLDDGPQRLRWIGSRRLSLDHAAPDDPLRPVRIRADAIAPGVPSRDMLVSPMHRVLLGGRQAQLFLGLDEVLAAARHLVNGETIHTDAGSEVEYFHLLFDRHQILISMNLRSESFYPGGVGLHGFGDQTRDEVLTLFPELRTLDGAYGHTARQVLKSHEAELFRRDLLPPPILTERLRARVA